MTRIEAEINELKWRLLMISKLSANLFNDPFNSKLAESIRDQVLLDNGCEVKNARSDDSEQR